MKRFAAILVAQFVVIFTAAFRGSWAFAHWRGIAATTPTQASTDELSWLQSALGLDTVQSAKLEKLHHEFEAQQAKLCETHCAARAELARLIKTSDAITTEMEALSKTMSEVEGKSERLTLDHIFAVGKELNASQREKFVAKVHDQMCSSCPMGAHRPVVGKQASCGSTGCACCIASDSEAPQPAQPLASLPAPQPRLDLFGFATPPTLSAASHRPQKERAATRSGSRPLLPLYVVLSIFRI